jgi:hypothetical protein
VARGVAQGELGEAHPKLTRELRVKAALLTLQDEILSTTFSTTIRCLTFSRQSVSRTGGLDWHGDIASLLLQQQCICINHLNRSGRSALPLAAEEGMESVVKALLRAKSIDSHSADNDGRDGLSYAAAKRPIPNCKIPGVT